MRTLLAFLIMTATVSAQEPLNVFIGTYGRGPGEGIHRLSLHPATGELRRLGVAADADRPSFLALGTNKVLYAVSEVTEFDGKKTGAVAAIKSDPTQRQLVEFGRQASGGSGPCHLTVSPSGKFLLVANYGTGTIASLPIAADGSLQKASAVIQHPAGSKVNARRQEGPHAHSINVDATGRWAVAADLGCDALFVYELTDTGFKSTEAKHRVAATPGAGPRHFAFHPNNNLAFAINELNSTLISYRFDAKSGALTEIETKSTLPGDFKGDNTTAEVQVHPSGKFVYGSNRGHNSIALFALDPATGKLDARGHTSTQGKTPRNFGIDPSGKFLLAANQDSNSVVAFRIDPDTGALVPTGSAATVTTPVCVKFF